MWFLGFRRAFICTRAMYVQIVWFSLEKDVVTRKKVKKEPLRVVENFDFRFQNRRVSQRRDGVTHEHRRRKEDSVKFARVPVRTPRADAA